MARTAAARRSALLLALCAALVCGSASAARRRLFAPSTSAAGAGAARLAAGPFSTAALGLVPPVAQRRPHAMRMHGDVRTDDYYWLRDDARRDPGVLAYIDAENTYAAAIMNETRPLQEELYREMRARIKEDDSSVPVRYKGYWYYVRAATGSQYEVHCRRRMAPAAAAAPLTEADGPEGSSGGFEEEVLLDENRRRQDGGFKFYMVDEVAVSPDQTLLAWTEDTVGGEKYDLHVKDLATGAAVMEPIRSTSGSVVWANDNKHLFYVIKDRLDRPYKVMRHKIGDPVTVDVSVYEEPDDAFYVSIGRSESDRMVFVRTGSAITSETLFLDADAPTQAFQVLFPRQLNVEYGVSHHPGGPEGGAWFLITMRDAARPNSELLVAPLSNTSDVRVIVPHRSTVQLEGVSVSQKHLLLHERADAATRVVLHALPPSGAALGGPLAGPGKTIQFDEAVHDVSGAITGEWDSDVLRLAYNSLTTPPSVIDYHIPSGRRMTRRVQPVLGPFKQQDYASERLWATAPDGTKVPISLVYRKDSFKRDGSSNLLLYAYGSYGMSTDPKFDSRRLSLLDRGWGYAIAHIRGGGDLGRLWYEDGKFLKKRNTFGDFIACAQHLVDGNYSSPARLAIEGRSAGGMLIGAVLNMRPDLFHAAIAGVPFVDVLTTMLDESIPLTTTEFDEWGNPAKPNYYAYIKSYSVVDNVARQRYPHLLVTAGLHDPRVGYWEPAKWVAKLRATQAGANLLLLKTEMGAGHFSVTGRFDKLRDRALEYAFLLKAAASPDRAGGSARGRADGGRIPSSHGRSQV